MQSRSVVLAAAIAALLNAQQVPPELSALFERSLEAGPASPAALELRRQGAPAVEFLRGVVADDPQPKRRVAAMDHLMRMGSVAEPAVDTVLGQLVGDGVCCHTAVIALGELGPFLSTASLRQRVADALLARYHKAPTAELAYVVQRSWHRLQLAATDDVDVLVQWLRSGNPFAIEVGCQLLAEQGARARSAMPAVAELLRQDVFPLPPAAPGGRQVAAAGNWRLQVRDSLFAFVQAVDPGNPAALPLMLERLPRVASQMQLELLQQIGRMGAQASSAVPALVPLLNSKVPEIARETVTVLAIVGADSAEVRAAIEPLVSSPDRQLAARAKAALRVLGRSSG